MAVSNEAKQRAGLVSFLDRGDGEILLQRRSPLFCFLFREVADGILVDSSNRLGSSQYRRC